MKKIPLYLISAMCLLSCSTTSSVDLYRITDSGELYNVGRSAKPGNEIYGHFFSKDLYDRGELSLSEAIIDGTVKSMAKTCFISFVQYEGIRVEPCQLAYLTNEGPLGQPEGLDKIGVYSSTMDSKMGSYALYAYNTDTKIWDLLYTVPIHQDHWNAGIDVVRRDSKQKSGLIFLRSLDTEDGNPPLLLKNHVILWGDDGHFVEPITSEGAPMTLEDSTMAPPASIEHNTSPSSQPAQNPAAPSSNPSILQDSTQDGQRRLTIEIPGQVDPAQPSSNTVSPNPTQPTYIITLPENESTASPNSQNMVVPTSQTAPQNPEQPANRAPVYPPTTPPQDQAIIDAAQKSI